MEHSIVLAFDGDEAGDKASTNAVLEVLDLELDQRDFLRSYAFEGKEYSDAIRYLTNQSLSDEYRFQSNLARLAMPNWFREMAREHEQDCMRLIQSRSVTTSRERSDNPFAAFNSENTITDVLSSFGVPAVAGRTVRCPMHDDSTPSLSISRSDERAYCFNQSCALWHDGYGVDAYELNKIMTQ